MKQKKRHKGLGEVQIIAQIKSESKIMNYISRISRKKGCIPWFTKIRDELKMDNKVLRKRLDDLILRGEIREIQSKSGIRTHYKGYRITTKEESTNVENGMKFKKVSDIVARKKKYRDAYIENKKMIRKEKRRKRINEKNNGYDFNYYKTRKQYANCSRIIAHVIIKTEYFNFNKNKILEKYGVKEKTYESWIKRHPILQTIRKLLKNYSSTQLPYQFEDWRIESPVWIKRWLMYPNITKNHWFKKYTH